MDDLDLEKLKQELDDVSGGSRYDVEDIMREAGVPGQKQENESLEHLMHRFGIHMDESESDEEEPPAPVTENMVLKLSEKQPHAELLRAQEQTQQFIDEQEELAAAAQDEEEQPDPLEEQEDVFARLFNQLGQIEQDPMDSVFSKPEEQAFTDPRTEMLEEPEDEPDLMARLFDGAPVSGIEREEMPSAESEMTELEDEHTVHIDTADDWKMTEEIADDTHPTEHFQPIDEQKTQVLEPIEQEPAEQPEEQPEKKSFWSKWFSVDDEDDEDDEESDDEEEEEAPIEDVSLADGQETQILQPIGEESAAQPEEQPEKKSFWSKWFSADDEDDDEDEEEEEAPIEDVLTAEEQETQILQPIGEEPAEQPEEQHEKKSFWSKWFSVDDDDDEDDEESDDEEEEEASIEDVSTTDDQETQILEPIEEESAGQPDEKHEKKGFWSKWFSLDDDEDDEDDEESEEEEASIEDVSPADGQETQVLEPMNVQSVEQTGVPEEEIAPDDVAQEEQKPISEPEEIYVHPEPEEIEDKDIGIATFTEAMAQEEAIGATEETPEPPHNPEPEDDPVISEEELEQFLSDVEDKQEQPIASFEQILRDNGMDPDTPVRVQRKISLDEFPEETTTVYVDVPVREKSEPQEDEPEFFDAEADLEAQAMDEKIKQEKLERMRKRLQPEPDPEWLNMPLEELCKTAPALEDLRQEGPVMQREVARQREWIMERHRAYMKAEHPTLHQEEQPPVEEELPEEDSEPSVIDAAGALRDLLQQEQGIDNNSSVFSDRSDGTPETESDDREEMLTESRELEELEQTTQPEPLQEVPDTADQSESSEQLESEPHREQTSTVSQKSAKKRKTWPKEDVPQDLRKASAGWKQRAQIQAQRSIAVAVLTVIAVYLSCAADFSLPLSASMDYVESPSAVLISFIVLQLIAMVVAFDVIRDGILAAIYLHPNFSTLVDLALVLNLVHCIIRLVWDGEEMPYTCAAMLALFAQMRARVCDARARHYTYKVAAGASQPVGIYLQNGDPKHIIKAPMEQIEPFIQQVVKPDRTRKLESILTILSIVVSIVLSIIVCTSTGDNGRLIYVLAATVTGACQVALLLAIPMGRANAARHMMKGGTALDGMRGGAALASVNTVVLTDEDLFPTGSVALERLELHSQLNDTTALAYAAALAGQSSLGRMLAEEVRARYGAPLTAHHVMHYTGGGISGQAGGLEILLGDADFMAERGILTDDVPENGLILAVEGTVAAVLVVDYQVPAVLFNAMQVLTERHIHILLHTRNHQVTTQLVERLYGLPEGTVRLPDLEVDRAMRSPHYAADGMLCGVMLRDGLVPFADCISTAHVQNRLAKGGTIIGIIAAIICMLLMTYLCFVFVPIDARPIRVLLYAILCFVPIFFLENGVGRD